MTKIGSSQFKICSGLVYMCVFAVVDLFRVRGDVSSLCLWYGASFGLYTVVVRRSSSAYSCAVL